MTPHGTMVPGLEGDPTLSVLAMLIGSNSDSGDVTGVYYGDPATVKGGSSAFKDWYNASFQSLHAGYVFETSEYDPEFVNQMVPGTLLTTTRNGFNNFDTAGLIRPGIMYVDQIIGIVVRGIRHSTSNADINCIAFQGLPIPRMSKDAVDVASLRD